MGSSLHFIRTIMTLLPSCGRYIFIGLTFCDTIYLSTENEPWFFPSCWVYVCFIMNRNVVDVLRMCQTAEKLFPQRIPYNLPLDHLEREHIPIGVALEQKLQHLSYCIIFTAFNGKFCSRLGREVCVTTSYSLCTRGLIPRLMQMLIQRKLSGRTCVVAPPKCWPGPMILPEVAQIPVTLVLHQAKNLLPWKWAKLQADH